MTRDFDEQATRLPADGGLDAVLLTHAHRDASGGLPRLVRWLAARGRGPAPLYAHPETVERIRGRYRRLEAFDLRPLEPGRTARIGAWRARGIVVPHAKDTPTYAWRLTRGAWSMVYASDVARLTRDLARFARGADLLVLDGAMWGRGIFSHLRGDEALPEVCGWDVGGVVLTQIGRTAPEHGRLEREARRLCRRARPAYDGLALQVPAS